MIVARSTSVTSVTELSSDSAQWWAGLTKAAGGSGSHPTPHQLLDSALAACTVLTILLYAKRKDYPLESIRVSVDSEEGKSAYAMKSTLEISGPLTQQQRVDLLRVANACPVHKTLSGKLTIDTVTM